MVSVAGACGHDLGASVDTVSSSKVCGILLTLLNVILIALETGKEEEIEQMATHGCNPRQKSARVE